MKQNSPKRRGKGSRADLFVSEPDGNRTGERIAVFKIRGERHRDRGDKTVADSPTWIGRRKDKGKAKIGGHGKGTHALSGHYSGEAGKAGRIRPSK